MSSVRWNLLMPSGFAGDERQSGPVRKRGKPVILASAGGVQALQNFFGALPNRTDAAFVVVVHLDPHHRSEMATIIDVLAEILHRSRVTPMFPPAGTLPTSARL
jgi:hypothetical protein